ncbi:4-amino-4-deoxy-L-arabinose-phosphoundecaprenol flippase subunit ArnE [Pseudomonas sp. B2M1-30]|uniref:Probable 4-amino-4-deoxy-L-arabinose-phosphoundecaprenol flippase subunit ArnE n=1 Tax=Pseudomonas koreensis TaxID=198620 RepID=A0A9X2XEM2_9PSED|nr:MULTISPECIES: 4-amino-4-deoxy-L-arabinose-phosphoundecaprenol flippase subunit ArnE [Pseudomonas]MBV4473542.1 EamA family transporter [Pseudomonas botevensis]MCU0117679.1 4-amino-4-deoxy-L-arabinose-phosphoundecaprenol flippase subunit ArnE [Pseudomonas sp. B2M1-30]MCU7247139.1 4-amino-4-deoxy-L-arabinose-phosphoundecaprenol flippase subunit ArnE [Pseudomonas koreensis]MCU7259215.1 4-amino-4-deoxy-L-arabinose-phosphoundecaprenol flippase subunit ArnE [Pseudomonas koreensis]
MSLLLLLIACLLTCLGQVAQKYAVESWRGADSSWADKLRTPWLWVALCALGAGLLVWLLVLQRLDVGIAYPMLSLNFVIITLIARFVFREHIDRRHWFGVALVLGGVALLGQHA